MISVTVLQFVSKSTHFCRIVQEKAAESAKKAVSGCLFSSEAVVGSNACGRLYEKVPRFSKNDAVFEKIVALFEKISRSFFLGAISSF